MVPLTQNNYILDTPPDKITVGGCLVIARISQLSVEKETHTGKEKDRLVVTIIFVIDIRWRRSHEAIEQVPERLSIQSFRGDVSELVSGLDKG